MQQRRGLLLAVALAVVANHGSSAKFLLMSSPAQSKVFYLNLGGQETVAELAPAQLEPVTDDADPKKAGQVIPSQHAGAAVLPLIDHTIKTPMGLAWYPKRQILFVADPKANQVWSFPTRISGGSLSVGAPTVAVRNVPARWVAVDARGNLFLSNEGENVVQMVTAANVRNGVPEVKTLYTAVTSKRVSGPGGLAADGLFLYWTNKNLATSHGSIVKGFAYPSSPDSGVLAEPLSVTSGKVFGVCVSDTNVFYTDSQSFLYGVKKAGGKPVMMSGAMVAPKGCAGDGDGTVYVADRAGNQVYSFASNEPQLSAIQNLDRVVEVEAPFALAVINSAASQGVCVATLLLVVAQFV